MHLAAGRRAGPAPAPSSHACTAATSKASSARSRSRLVERRHRRRLAAHRRRCLSRSSTRATRPRCTSSGPSARRSARADAYSRGEREVVGHAGAAVQLDRHVDHLRRPCRGTSALICETSLRGAPSTPTVSSIQAVSQHQQPRLVDGDAGLRDPLAVAAEVEPAACRTRCGRAPRAAGQLERRLGRPISRMQWWMRPGPSRPWAISKPRPGSGDDRVRRGSRTSVNVTSPCPNGSSWSAEDRQHPLDLTPGASRGHEHHASAGGGGRRRVGEAHEDQAARSGDARCRCVHHLRPSTTTSSPSSRAVAACSSRPTRRRRARSCRTPSGSPRAAAGPASALAAPSCRTAQHLHVAGVRGAAVEDLGREQLRRPSPRRAARTRRWSGRRRASGPAGTGSTAPLRGPAPSARRPSAGTSHGSAWSAAR